MDSSQKTKEEVKLEEQKKKDKEAEEVRLKKEADDAKAEEGKTEDSQ